MTKEKLLDLLNEEIEKAGEMHRYYKELLIRYEGKIEALKDLRDDLNQKEEEKKGEQKNGKRKADRNLQ